MRTIWFCALLACVALGSVGAAVAPDWEAFAFVPHEFTMYSSEYDRQGVLPYQAYQGYVVKPVSSTNGTLTCNDKESIVVTLVPGAIVNGYVQDRYTVLAQSASPPEGTVLNCVGTWGLYTYNGILGREASLYVNIIYNTGTPPAIEFVPASLTLSGSQSAYTGTLAYTAFYGYVPKPIAPADGYLACAGGYAIPLAVKAGGYDKGLIDDSFTVTPTAVSPKPPPGTQLSCQSTWGVYDSGGKLLALSTLQATVSY